MTRLCSRPAGAEGESRAGESVVYRLPTGEHINCRTGPEGGHGEAAAYGPSRPSAPCECETGVQVAGRSVPKPSKTEVRRSNG